MSSAKTNITLIGMPGAGKSTIGVILAKNLALGFVDTDVLIQTSRGASLQSLLESRGHLGLRQIEEEEILKLEVRRHVIATGGSAAYSERAMRHLNEGETVVISGVAKLQPGMKVTLVAPTPNEDITADFKPSIED